MAKIIDVTPKVKNSELFVNDLNYILKKANKRWVAAQKGTEPVKSVYVYMVNFNTEVFDHD